MAKTRRTLFLVTGDVPVRIWETFLEPLLDGEMATDCAKRLCEAPNYVGRPMEIEVVENPPGRKSYAVVKLLDTDKRLC